MKFVKIVKCKFCGNLIIVEGRQKSIKCKCGKIVFVKKENILFKGSELQIEKILSELKGKKFDLEFKEAIDLKK